ncbi:Pol [Sesbania bispinosa]|nr:Pol [Sesbania bispinosa]
MPLPYPSCYFPHAAPLVSPLPPLESILVGGCCSVCLKQLHHLPLFGQCFDTGSPRVVIVVASLTGSPIVVGS